MKKLAMLVALNLPFYPIVAAPSCAAGVNWKQLIEIAPDLKDVIDATIDISTGDVPGLYVPSTELSGTAKRAASFHPSFVFKTAPAVRGDRLWSADAKVRASTIKEYEDFVRDNGADIASFKERRDEQQATLKRYEDSYERMAQFSRAAPDLIERASRLPQISETLATEIAGTLVEVEGAGRVVDQIVRDFRRIVGEYDVKLNAARAAHEAHVHILRTLKSMQPPEATTTLPDDVVPGEKPNQPGGAKKADGYSGGIGAAVDRATPVSGEAASHSHTIAQNHSQVGPTPPSTPTWVMQGPAPTQKQPAWTGSMSPR